MSRTLELLIAIPLGAACLLYTICAIKDALDARAQQNEDDDQSKLDIIATRKMVQEIKDKLSKG